MQSQQREFPDSFWMARSCWTRPRQRTGCAKEGESSRQAGRFECCRPCLLSCSIPWNEFRGPPPTWPSKPCWANCWCSCLRKIPQKVTSRMKLVARVARAALFGGLDREQRSIKTERRKPGTGLLTADRFEQIYPLRLLLCAWVRTSAAAVSIWFEHLLQVNGVSGRRWVQAVWG